MGPAALCKPEPERSGVRNLHRAVVNSDSLGAVNLRSRSAVTPPPSVHILPPRTHAHQAHHALRCERWGVVCVWGAGCRTLTGFLSPPFLSTHTVLTHTHTRTPFISNLHDSAATLKWLSSSALLPPQETPPPPQPQPLALLSCGARGG